MEQLQVYRQYRSDEGLSLIKEIEGGDFSVERSNALKESFRELLDGDVQIAEQVDLEPIGVGGTSICYRSCSQKRIYKAFRPHGFELQPVSTKHGTFSWISDSATDETRKDFLMRFVRFIAQSRIINNIESKAKSEQKNLFINPTLHLTSKGLVWSMEHLYGKSLSEECSLLTDRDERNEEWVLRRMEMVMKTAENIRTYFHGNGEGIFHGDIKPDNFFKITSDKDDYLIRNIDFDTCTSSAQIEAGYLRRYIATTESYYDREIIRDLLKNEVKDFDSWAILDIWALAKVLMFAISTDTSIEQEVGPSQSRYGSRQEWYEVFRKQELGNLHRIFGTTSLVSLFIINELDRLLRRCSICSKEKFRIRSIDGFIDGLANVMNLIRFMINKEYECTPQIIRCAGLRMLDQRATSSIEYKATDTVEEALSKYFVK